jgi:hypothetical protein
VRSPIWCRLLHGRADAALSPPLARATPQAPCPMPRPRQTNAHSRPRWRSSACLKPCLGPSIQIEGAFLETRLPSVFDRLEELARLCRARHGSLGAFIEDKNSGTILLQQALRRGMPAQAIDSRLTAVGRMSEP